MIAVYPAISLNMIAASSRVGFALSEAPIRFLHLRADPDYNFNSQSAHWRSIRANCRSWRGGWFSTRLECAQHPVNHFAVIRLRDSIATDWLSKVSEHIRQRHLSSPTFFNNAMKRGSERSES